MCFQKKSCTSGCVKVVPESTRNLELEISQAKSLGGIKMGEMSAPTWSLLALVILSILCFSSSTATATWQMEEALKEDGHALLAFKSALQDPQGLLRDWDLHQSPCLWPGVGCGRVGRDTRVVTLELKSARLQGTISSRIGELSELGVLTIAGNKLSGSIPEELTNCQKLTTLDLRGNGLSGPLPAGIFSLLPNLRTLFLSDNHLSGHLQTLFSARNGQVKSECKNLRVLDVARNRLTGRIPVEFGFCSELHALHLGSNYLVGRIPSQFGKLHNLRFLILENNVLDGSLPQELQHCTDLELLDVSTNFLGGGIPSSYGQLRHLRDLRVASNRLTGPIPRGKWLQQAQRREHFEGNKGLCDSPLQSCEKETSFFRHWKASTHKFWTKVMSALQRWEASPNKTGAIQSGALFGRTRRSMLASSPKAAPAPAPAPTRSSRRSNATRWGLGIALGLATGAVGAALLALTIHLVMLCCGRRSKRKGPIVFHKKISPNMLTFLEKEDALASAELVGEGGNGKVYKVTLGNGELDVAVKCVQKSITEDKDANDVAVQSNDAKQIQAELETLGRVRHRNLVQLLAYVYRPESHLLVYEYMPKGSLHDALLQMARGDLTLSWPQRHHIMVGVAQGLAYLHKDSLGNSIIHRDLKPANILLDDSFEAKVADFGLAVILPDAASHATTDAIAGTIGYIAPEYHQTLRYSDKSDIYSFGVVLAQVLTGKMPTDPLFSDHGGSIGGWLAQTLHNNAGPEAIDPQLRGTGYDDEILLAMKIAVFCTMMSPAARPSSSDVLQMLTQVHITNPSPIYPMMDTTTPESGPTTEPGTTSNTPPSGSTGWTDSTASS